MHGDRAAEGVPGDGDARETEVVEHGQRIGHVLLDVPRWRPR
jgi:hypothetical protein